MAPLPGLGLRHARTLARSSPRRCAHAASSNAANYGRAQHVGRSERRRARRSSQGTLHLRQSARPKLGTHDRQLIGVFHRKQTLSFAWAYPASRCHQGQARSADVILVSLRTRVMARASL
jgi:hypothetical protein